MKTFIHQALILGGLYFVVSLIVSVLRFLGFGAFWGLVNVAVFIVFAAIKQVKRNISVWEFRRRRLCICRL